VTTREPTEEEIEDYARRMAWAGIPDEHRVSFLAMARSAWMVHQELSRQAQFEEIVQPRPGPPTGPGGVAD
jgi:hypothetical protein